MHTANSVEVEVLIQKEENAMLSEEILDFVKKKLSVVTDQDIQDTPLNDGRSGAEVYSIKVKSRKNRFNGHHIVKICNSAEERSENEAEKARQLYEYAPQFSDHLVKVEATGKVGERDVIIYAQANKSHMHSVSFSKLDGEHIAKYTRWALYDLLACLNKTVQIDGTIENFYNSLLKKQLGTCGRFVPRMETLLNRPEAECVVINGIVYPNPLYFMKHISNWSGHISDIHLFKGAIHGDLHGLNLLAAEDSYSIIDFDSTKLDSYLLFDHAYFEFSVFYDNYKDNDLKRWNSMLEQLTTPSLFKTVSSNEHYLEYMVRNAVCQSISEWIENEDLENEKDDIELQFLMARIAAGINFFCKKTCADIGKQAKVLLYISHCLKQLLKKIKYPYDENDISRLNLPSAFTDTECLWNGFLKFTNYVTILITDDMYSSADMTKFRSLCNVRWSLVVDIGQEKNEPILYKSFLQYLKNEPVKRIDLIAGETIDTFAYTFNVLSLRNPGDGTYSKLWRTYGKKVLKNIERLMSENFQVPLILVFDCGRESLAFRDQLINHLCDLTIPGATRFVSLRAPFSEDLHRECKELEDAHRWHFIEYFDTTLLHVATSCAMYLNTAYQTVHSANLPSLDGIYTLSEEDLLTFYSSIEVVYSGCEYAAIDKNGPVGFDMSGGGDSLGEAFYKGNEATWNDIANHRDLGLLEDKKYKKVQERLRKLLEENSPRVRKMRLVHGAGTGGTTLSKRILWDLKDTVPCVRLKKYSQKTADILLEVYRKTGKKVLMTVEQGSTIITDDELNVLIQQVNSENGKLFLLLIVRSDETAYSTGPNEEASESDVLVRLTDIMPVPVALPFETTFSAYASKREESGERIKLLKAITGESLKEQRSPFFYGFYAFQEEYNLMDTLKHTISLCSDREKVLLNNLALITAFSQNICVTFGECLTILDLKNDDGCMNIYVMMEELPTAISKLTVMRTDGFRLCHRIIAEKVLLLLHNPEGTHNGLGYVIFQAASDYIKTLCQFYENGSEDIDKKLKELLIDRAYIDADEKKTKFSPLVETIPYWTNKKALFELLIESFPQNPHYYNHLARLLAFGDKKNGILPQYEEAVSQGEQAIRVAEESNVPVSTHRTTLGCIYGQWVIHDIKAEIANKRAKRLTFSYPQLIDYISVYYNLACAEFVNARNSIERCNRFSYFPQINMECEIIEHLIQFDQDRNLSALIEQEPSFKDWYDEHFSIAVELTKKMEDQSEDNAALLSEARNKLSRVAMKSNEQLKRQLNKLLESDSTVDKRHRRALTYAAFVKNGASWNMNSDLLDIAEQCFRRNIEDADGIHKSSDVETWFELYRRTSHFNAAEAQAIIADHMEDGYKKEYILFLLAFVLCEQGTAGASPAAVTIRAREAQRLARLRGINTIREHDFFSSPSVTGCPIVPVADVKRNNYGEPVGLKVFKGTVIEVEHTHGKILLDRFNLEVTFIPNPSSVNSEPQRTFTRQDITHHVELNLMFSYSGLRAWNVTKID